LAALHQAKNQHQFILLEVKMMSPISNQNIVIINEIEKHKIIDIDKIK
jgi:hypothetical protein